VATLGNDRLTDAKPLECPRCSSATVNLMAPYCTRNSIWWLHCTLCGYI